MVMQVSQPTPPSISVALTSDSGVSATDHVTATQSFHVAADPNSRFTLTVMTASGSTIATASSQTDSGGSYDFSFDGLADGAYTLIVSTKNASDITSTASVNFTLDTTRPTATASNPINHATNAATVTETVTFSEAVANVSASTFALARTGTASGHVGAVTQVGSDGKTFAVTIDRLSGDGSLRLMAAGSNPTTDIAGNSLSSISGGALTLDHTAPTATFSTGVTGTTNASTVTETVTFSEAVTGVTASSFAVTTTGNAAAHVQSVTALGSAGTTYAVTLDGLAGTGTVHLGLAQNSGVADAAGNAAAGGTGSDISVLHSSPAPVSCDLSMLPAGQQSTFTGQNALYIPGGPSDVVIAPTAGGVTLTYHGSSYTFADGTLSAASQAGNAFFSDGTQLLVGTDTGNDMLTGLTTGDHLVLGFGGDDDINVGNGNNVISGGLGSDIVYAYEGNNHIWGNASGTAGQADGGDRIVINGGGSNYVNGNAGDDTIEAGTGGSTGANRLYGGAGQDVIVLHGAGANAVNGNMGQDTIDASDATGNNLLRGGQGDDVIRAGHGRDQLLGDVGADTLVAGTGAGHLTILTGGADADTFDFSRGSQGQVTVAGTTYQSGVTDFAHGTDHVGLAFAVGAGGLLTSTTSFGDVASAQAYAQALLAGHAGTADVAALQVGGDTVLFYDAAGTADTIDSVVRLSGVNAGTLTTGDFVAIAG